MMPSRSGGGSHIATHYGHPISVYAGKGALTLDTGQEIPCDFEAGQLANGEILVLCDWKPKRPELALGAMFQPPVTSQKLVGTTNDNCHIIAEGLTRVNYLAKSNRVDFREGLAECYYAFNARTLRVNGEKSDVATRTVRFGITNFCFEGTEPLEENGVTTDVLPLSLADGERRTEIVMKPVRQAEEIMQYVSTLKGIEVTAEAIGTIREPGELPRLCQVIDDVCYLLSVAHGTKIQWIYYHEFDEADYLLVRNHQSRWTRPLCALAIIRGNTAENGQLISRTKVFVEQTYPNYVAKRESFRLNTGTIDAYLEAKAESDLLEMRGVKLTVAMEMLKAVFLDLPDCPIKEFMVDEEEFAPYVPLIQATAKALMKAVIDQRARDGGKGTINVQHLQSVLESRKLAALNRTSFKQIMTKLFRYIGFDPGREITPFVQCRNSLVHRGHFYATTATEAQRRACPPLATLQEEYLFLVSFLDRVFLKLLGYSGEYIDYRLPWEGFGRKRMI